MTMKTYRALVGTEVKGVSASVKFEELLYTTNNLNEQKLLEKDKRVSVYGVVVKEEVPKDSKEELDKKAKLAEEKKAKEEAEAEAKLAEEKKAKEEAEAEAKLAEEKKGLVKK